MFKSRDVILRCLNYNFDDSPEGEYAELIMAGGAELFRKQNRRQVIQKMKACLERGYYPFSRKRGHDRIVDPVLGKTFVPNDDGRLMKTAIEGFATGRFRRKVDVARFLHEQGFWNPTKRPPEKFIDDVTDILSDIFHAGHIEYPEWGVTRRKGIHKGIITLDTYELVQKRLRKEETKAHIRLDISPEFPLRGLVLCSHCNQKVTAAPSKGRSKTYQYYYCRTKGCPLFSKMIAKDRIERDFRAMLRDQHLKEDVDAVVQLTFDRVWREETSDFKKRQDLKAHRKEQLEQNIREFSNLARTATSEVVKQAYEAQIEDAERNSRSTNRGKIPTSRCLIEPLCTKPLDY